MKKLICILFASLILLAAASAEYDFSAMTDEQLLTIINDARNELLSRETRISGKTYLVNDEYAEIYFTGKAKDLSSGEYKMEVVFVNKTDNELSFYFDDIILNGWQLTGYNDISSTAAGAKSKGALWIDYQYAELSSWQEITELELRGPHLVGPGITTIARYNDIILDVAGSTWE